jgi:hypothetical protein
VLLTFLCVHLVSRVRSAIEICIDLAGNDVKSFGETTTTTDVRIDPKVTVQAGVWRPKRP